MFKSQHVYLHEESLLWFLFAIEQHGHCLSAEDSMIRTNSECSFRCKTVSSWRQTCCEWTSHSAKKSSCGAFQCTIIWSLWNKLVASKMLLWGSKKIGRCCSLPRGGGYTRYTRSIHDGEIRQSFIMQTLIFARTTVKKQKYRILSL